MIKNDRGSALVLALISLAMLMVLSAGLVTITNNEWRSSKLSVRDLEYKYLAESGIERALAELRRDMLWTPTLGQFQPVDGDQGYKFDQWEWDSARQVFKIKSTAVVAGQPHTSIYVELKPEALPHAFNYAACAQNEFRAGALGIPGLSNIYINGEVHANSKISMVNGLLPPFVEKVSTDDNDPGDFTFIDLLDILGLGLWRPPRGEPGLVLQPTVDWDYYRRAAQDFGRYFDHSVTLLAIGSLDRLIFVDGDATIISAELERCTLVATGYVWIYGLDVLDLFNSGKLTIIAGQDINFDVNINLLHLSKTRGIFVAGRDINVPLGLNLLEGMKGTLVAGRNINFTLIPKGVSIGLGVKLEYDSDVSNPPPHVYWATTQPPKIVKWVETKA